MKLYRNYNISRQPTNKNLFGKFMTVNVWKRLFIPPDQNRKDKES